MIDGSEKPKSVSIGDWHFLKSLKVKKKYSDSSFYKNPAVLIRWKKSILAYESAKFAYIIGTNKNEKLSYVYNKAQKIKSISINFETNKFKIAKDQLNEIMVFIKENQFDFIVLNGYTDNRGSLETNYQLAEKRINNIHKIITKQSHVDKKKILKKVHGEFFSNKKTNNKEVDDKHERKVTIVLFKVNE